MSLPSVVPALLVRDAIARVESDGRLSPVTDAMVAWVSQVADHIDRLPLSDEQRAAMQSGDCVVLSLESGLWEIRLSECEGELWLVVADVEHREHYMDARLSASRCRFFGDLAATLAHDLSNQLNSVLALTGQLSVCVRTDAERQEIAQLEFGTKAGARMSGVIARLLSRSVRKRSKTQPGVMLRDTLSLVSKSLKVASVDLEIDVADELPAIRVRYEEAVQSVMLGISALQSAGVASLRCVTTAEPMVVHDGRERNCVVLRCHALGVDIAAIAPLLIVANGMPNALRYISERSGIMEGLATATCIQRCAGGSLSAARDGDRVILSYVWPAV